MIKGLSIIKYENLTIHDPTLNDIFSKSFVYDAPNRKLAHLGKLALIVDVEINNEFAGKIAEIISDVIKQEYYRSREQDQNVNMLVHFESALNKVNQALSTLASEGYVEWIDKFHVGIAALSVNKVHIAFTGKAKIFLLRQNEIVDVAQESASPQSNPARTFINVVSGDLQLDDKVILASPNFLNYFSLEKIKRTLSQYSSREAIANFKNLLHNPDNSALSTVILELKDERKEYKDNFDFLKKPRAKSVENMIDQHQQVVKQTLNNKTEQLSTPKPIQEGTPTVHGYGEIKQRRPSLEFDKNDRAKSKKSRTDYTKYIDLAKENILRFKDKALPVFESVASSIKSLKGKKVSAKRIKSRTSISTRSYLSPKTSTDENRFSNLKTGLIKNVATFFQNLPLKSKIVLGATGAVGIVLIFSLFLRFNSNDIDKPIAGKKDVSLIEQAKELNKKASDALIYNDEDKALGYFLEAQVILNGLMSDEKYKTEAEDLLSKIGNELDKINNVNRLENLALIDIPSEINAKGILGLGGKIYTYDESKEGVYLIDEKTKKIKEASEESNGIGNLKFGAINLFKDYIEFLTDANSVSEFVLDDNNIYDIGFELGNNEQVIDFKNYYDALYVLDPSSDQIWKHQRTIDGYNKGEKWLDADSNNLDDANSFAIDGSIYVLKDNGEILSFLSGASEKFELSGLDKTIGSGGKIFTLLDYQNLYILDSANERIVILDKNGAFVNQFVSSEFKEGRDIYVDEETNQAYILSTNKVLVTPITNSEEN